MLAPLAMAADWDVATQHKLMSTHILVAGATGRNGGAILAALEAAGAKPRAMTRNIDKARVKAGDAHDWVQADVTKPETLAAAFRGIDVIIDAVATSNIEGPNGTEQVDLEGTRHLIAAARSAGVKRVIMITGMLVGLPFSNLPPPMAKALGAKREAEKLLIASGLDYVILRPTGILDRLAGIYRVRIIASSDYRPSQEEVQMRPANSGAPSTQPPAGTISRADLARVAIASSIDRAAARRVFVVTQGVEPADDAWRATIGKMPRE